MNEIEKEIKKLSSLVQYRKKDKSIIEQKARINVWKRKLQIENRFNSTEEKALAKELLDNYLDSYSFTSYNDIQNIGDLVFEETVKIRLQKQIDKFISDNKPQFVDKTMTMLHSIEERMWELKERVGIGVKKEQSELTALQELQKKFKIYQSFNRNEFTFYAPIVCNKCGEKDVQPILIRRRCNKEKYDVLIHPAFSGRFLYNKEIFKDIKEGKLTKEQGARFQRTSVKYIEWVLKNENKIININGVEKENLDEFIDNNPNLEDSSFYKEDKK